MTTKPTRTPRPRRRNKGWVNTVQVVFLALALAGYISLVGILPRLDERKKAAADTAIPENKNVLTLPSATPAGTGATALNLPPLQVPPLTPLAVTPEPLPTVAPVALLGGQTGASPAVGNTAPVVVEPAAPLVQPLPTLPPVQIQPLPTVAPAPQRVAPAPQVVAPAPVTRSRGS